MFKVGFDLKSYFLNISILLLFDYILRKINFKASIMNNSVKKFGIINTIEGYSYLILLFIAMPIKYFLGFPLAVKIAGMAHGILFILFVILLVVAWQDRKWDFKENIIFFIASLIPFGTFFTKKKIEAYA